MNCADCEEMDCYRGKDDTVIAEDAARIIAADPAIAEALRVAAGIEADGYGEWIRVEEVARYAERMGFRRIGLAFCIGMAAEARVLQAYYKAKGFKVYSCCCKLGALSKEALGMKRLHPEWDVEASCNPVGQALELNRCRTELNLIVGLCIGHDILFTQHSDAPVSTLVVKDRVLGHNPAAVLHTGYGRRRLGV